MHTPSVCLLGCLLLAQLALVAGEVKVVLQAFDSDGNALSSPHDIGNDKSVKIRCTFPSFSTQNKYFPVEIKIVTITDKNKEIYQAVCKQHLNKYEIMHLSQNKYKGVGSSIAYSQHCDHNSLQYEVKISGDLPKNFRCYHTSVKGPKYTNYFMYAPANVTITREPSSPVVAGSDVTFLCTSTKSKPAALLKFVLDTELNSSVVEHTPSVESIKSSYRLTSSSASQSETELKWATKARAKYDGKILKCLGEHPGSKDGSLVTEHKIDWAAGRESTKPTQPEKLEGKSRPTLSTPIIAGIVALGVAVASIIATTLYMTFRKRKIKRKKKASSATIGRPASTITKLSSKSSKSSRSSRSGRSKGSKRKH